LNSALFGLWRIATNTASSCVGELAGLGDFQGDAADALFLLAVDFIDAESQMNPIFDSCARDPA